MSKTTTTIILPAEDSGWEVWQDQQGVLQKVRTLKAVLSKDQTSSGERLALPVRAVATMPIRVASSDEALYRGAAQLELEKAGLLINAEGESWDCTMIADQGAGSIVAGYALLEDMLDPESVIQDVVLDYSPRCYPVDTADLIVCLKEQGEWALVCYSQGKPFYTEPLGKDFIGALAPAVKQLEVQLMLSGVEFEPQSIQIWTGDAPQLDESVSVQLTAETGLPVVIDQRPVPVVSEQGLKIRTEGMIGWKQKQQAGSRARVWFLGVALMYLVAAGYVFLKWKNLNDQIADQDHIIKTYQGSYGEKTLHDDKWEELHNLVRQDWPLAVYRRCTELLPPGNRIKFDMIEAQDGSVVLSGSAAELDPINDYIPKLKADEMFTELEWLTPMPARNRGNDQRWYFKFEAKKEEVL
ncbi:hypothetical protein Rhal01_03060 [Rubritalea halochordaticola]|uniref:Uncharacterized protein n=1 Tax=Rubritalea halochordaticola TaxID=714537 RepID=A0ABP9V2H7_9BACT